MRLAELLAFVTVAALLAGCGAAAPTGSLGPRPAARLAAGAGVSTLTPTTPAEGFRACGATQPPPASVLATAPRTLPPVLDGTAGAVDESTARQWAAAFFREQAIESWAGSAGQQGLLRGPCLSAARVRLSPVGNLARQPGPCGGEGCIVLRLTVAVTSLPMLQSLVLRHGGNPSRYMVEETVLAGGRLDTAVFGGFYQDGAIGPIWFIEASGLNCLDPGAKQLGLDCA